MQILWELIYSYSNLSIDIEEKNINSNSSLSTDMDIHNGEKRILCKFCDKPFLMRVTYQIIWEYTEIVMQ